MSFDQATRNRLQRFVNDARSLLADEFTRQLQQEYGLDPKTGEVADLSKLSHLDDSHLETARVLREILAHYLASEMVGSGKKRQKDVLDRIVREQAFTVLNRLAALRMMEARGLLRESIANGYQSQGFQLYERLAGHALGETGDAYRCYLFSLFDEFSLDLKVLFDRYAPQGLMFPRKPALLALLELLNAADMEPLWAEDETIGWIYQYWNSKEERKAMRDASAAPRNSRELAVRNQFFTPRYVVEFLTDNTLGRIWHEMTRGQTRLADQCRYLVRRPTEIFLAEGEAAPETPDQEGLSQEELLKQPVHIPHRPLKDPREIRLLDPACGSMHFGLYAFDLFETIYEEAWDNGSCPALQEAYPSKDEFLKDIPRLIIEHNIHGIDIDPRAVQIAGLSLWLRAQKAWQAQGFKPADRPRVRRSNIVCAEPMPASPKMLEDFVATLDPPLLRELVKTVFDKMQLAGEAGSLLKIEEEIRTAIDTARKEWLKQQDDLFTRQDGSQEEFFETAEQQVIDALRAYAEQADADSYQRRLFADDAARGFAFIDLCRKRYDAIVMNPPFGAASDRVFDEMDRFLPTGRTDLAAAFILRGLELSTARLGAIVTRSLFMMPGAADWRESILGLSRFPELLADYGGGVLDAFVETAATVHSSSAHSASLFFDCQDTEDKAAAKAQFVSSIRSGELNEKAFLRSSIDFEAIPLAPFCYWVDDRLLALFRKYSAFEPTTGDARTGLATLDNFRFLRCWWEVDQNYRVSADDTWKPLAKGGDTWPYFGDIDQRVLWKNNGSELKCYVADKVGSVSRKIQASAYYGRPGITWIQRSQLGFCPRPLPESSIFDTKGPSAFTADRQKLLPILGILSSGLFQEILDLQVSAFSYHPGVVQRSPFPRIGQQLNGRLKTQARRAYELAAAARLDESMVNFSTLSLFSYKNENLLSEAIKEYGATYQASLDELLKCADDLELAAHEAYDLIDSPRLNDRRSRTALRMRIMEREFGETEAEDLVSLVVGVALGRWDIRYATGERKPPELPDPFDPLPVCPPGMLQNADGLPAAPADVPDDYPLRITWPGILVGDDGHPEDVVARVREAIEVIWKDRAEAIELEASEILGVKTLRDYFRRPAAFFADHLKRYSKSRRKAPIYWPLSTKSGSYILWLYYHRLNDQTLYICVNEFVEPKLQQVTVNLESLRKKSDRTSKDEKDLSMFFDLKAEFEEYRYDLLRVAKFWKPDLNDGVQITAAPLWPLFRHKPWQKVLKDTWKKLEKGDYDWAHLAMNYWPDRVREKCRTDKSLAIAHGLEELYEEPPEQQKKARGRKNA